MKVPWNVEAVRLTVTKHFALGWMRTWGWDLHDLRDAIRDAYNVERTGANKFEIYVQKAGFKKIITAYYDQENELVCITGSQGGRRKP